MEIKFEPMGIYQTNCYIITIDDKDIIVDAGVDATKWVLKSVKNPVARVKHTSDTLTMFGANAEASRELKSSQSTTRKDECF